MRIRRIVRAKRKQTISLKLIKIIIVFLKEKKSLLNRDFFFRIADEERIFSFCKR